MKIIYVPRAPFGSASGAAAYMFPTLMAEFAQVMVASPPWQENSERRVFDNTNLNIHYFECYGYRHQANELVRLVDEFKPDIVHVFHGHRTVLYPSLVDQSSNWLPRWVLDIRSPLLLDGMKRARARLKGHISQYCYDAIFTHSPESAKSSIALMWKKAEFLPPGVSTNMFKPKPDRPRGRDGVRFVFVGSIAKERNIGLLVRAFHALRNQSDTPVSLDIFGGGDNLDEIKGLTRDLGMGEAVIFHGFVQQDQLFERLSDYDIGIGYVPCGKYFEAPSLKVMEYAAAGISILASDTLGLRRFEERGLAMQFFSNSEESFTEAANKSIADLENGNVNDGNLEAIQKFDWDYIVKDKLLKYYEKILS